MKYALLLVVIMCASFDSALAKGQQPITSVPFELVGEKIFLKAKVNGSEDINLQFDTGAGSSAIDSATAARIGLMASGESRNEGAAGSSVVPTSTSNTIEVKGLALHDITLLHLSLGDYSGTRRDAIIGYDMLKSYVIKIDYDNKTMAFYDAKHFKYAGKGKVNRFTLWSNSALMSIDLTLLSGQRLRGKVLVDDGADLPVLLNAPFVRKNDLMQKVGKVAKGSISGSDGSEVATYRGKVQKATLGGYSFSDFPVRLTEAQSGTLSLDELDGILGNPILKMFNITFDYRRNRMYWEQNQSFGQKVR